jgi:methylisocitrate lyase
MTGKKLKQLLKKGPVVMPGAFDCISALLIEKTGFKAGYLSGGGLSVSYLGKPDIGLLTLKDIEESTRRITSVCKLPFIVDVDTGFGGPREVAETVRALEKAGAAGVQIEDQRAEDKRCGHLAGKKVIPPQKMADKIRSAVRSRRSKDFLIVARTDARAVNGLGDAILRADLYSQAGADIIFPEALETKAEFAAFGANKRLGTLMGNMTEFGRSPSLTVSELAHLGFRLILYPMTAFRVAAHAMEAARLDLKSKGNSRSLVSRMQSRRELYDYDFTRK